MTALKIARWTLLTSGIIWGAAVLLAWLNIGPIGLTFWPAILSGLVIGPSALACVVLQILSLRSR